MSERKDGFSGRFGLVLAALGMAIGTGNLWRFPRIAASHEGGAFLIPWLVFLFTWSIPILIAEFTLGKTTGRGPIGAFAKLLGKRAAWMGAFMAFVTLMIATYYSVVTGWTLKYFISSIGGLDIPAATDPATIKTSLARSQEVFEEFAVRNPESATGLTLDEKGIPASLWFHLAAVAIAGLIVWRGIKGGIEVACKILIPALFLLLIGGTVWAITSLEGSEKGLAYFLTPNWSALSSPKIWIDGLSQSAWSTGAGWGLILAYAAYAKKDEDAVVTNRTAALGNNTASLLAGLFIFPAVFALLSQAGMAEAEVRGALAYNDPNGSSSGLAFTYIPFIFQSMESGANLFTTLFFLGLFFAALSSLIALYEMSSRIFIDMGMGRARAVIVVASIGAIVGGLAALDMRLFISMDWVWGLGLVIGGLAVAWAAHTYGVDRYRRKLINESGAQRKLGPMFNTLFVFLIPAQGLGMLGWWLYDAATDPGYYGAGNDPWDPTVLGHSGVGPCVIWWVTALGLFWALSPWLGRWSLAGDEEGAPDEDEVDRPYIRPLGLVVAALPWYLHFTEQSFGTLWGDMVGDADENTWKWFGPLVVFILVGGFIKNVFLAIGGRPARPPRRRRGGPPVAPTEVIGRDQEHA